MDGMAMSEPMKPSDAPDPHEMPYSDRIEGGGWTRPTFVEITHPEMRQRLFENQLDMQAAILAAREKAAADVISDELGVDDGMAAAIARLVVAAVDAVGATATGRASDDRRQA